MVFSATETYISLCQSAQQVSIVARSFREMANKSVSMGGDASVALSVAAKYEKQSASLYHASRFFYANHVVRSLLPLMQ